MARRPLRNVISLRRRPGGKPPRSITLIVCEGETERVYFDEVRVHCGLSTAEVICAENTHGPAPISVVECAESKCTEQGGYDHVFCVFDRDGHESFDRAREKVRALAQRKKKPLPIQDIVSVPCFEFWVLLHFERTDAPFHKCDTVIARVRVHLPDYVKADAATVKALMPYLDAAIANAEWVEQRAAENDGNPCTGIHHLIRHFRQVKQSNTQ